MPNRDPTGRILNNAVQSNRHANLISKQVGGILSRAGDNLADILQRRDPTPLTGARRIQRMRAINDKARDIINDTYKEIERVTRGNLGAFGRLQTEWAAGTLNVVGSATGAQIGSVVLGGDALGKAFWTALLTEDVTKNGLLVEGDTMRRWWTGQGAAAKTGFRRAVQSGMAEQETIGDIVRRVRGRYVRGQFRGGVIQAQTRQATALVRTAVNQVANRAHQEVYQANGDLTKKYRYVATLDNRTTMLCASLDGREFVYGEGPLPPQHFNCRSTHVPVIDYGNLAISKPPPGKRFARGEGTYTSADDYSKWLRAQPKETQVRVLGLKRTNLFRANRVSLRDLVRADGSTVTLDVLTERIGG